MKLEYRVEWETTKGKFNTEWLTELEAKRKYEKLKNEKVLKTIWAELIYASIEDDVEDEVIVIDSFTRPTTNILGKILITSK